MANVSDRGGKNRRGLVTSHYLSRKAKDLLERTSVATRRSQSEILSLLVEVYCPDMLADSKAGDVR